MKKTSLLLLIIFILSLTVNVYAVTMYAPDGRTIEVEAGDVQTWKNVGWYDSPFTTMYAPDGRTIEVALSSVQAWKSVGWYDSPYTTMYAPDGRTISVALADVQAWKNVGWFDSYGNAVKATIIGSWQHKEYSPDPTMQSINDMHSLLIRFNSDNSFYSSTWRTQCYGYYYVQDDGSIVVNYDVYFCGAGATEYSYYYSDSSHFYYSNSGVIIDSDSGEVYNRFYY